MSSSLEAPGKIEPALSGGKVRILQVNDLGEGGAGAETHLLSLVHRLRVQGHPVELFSAAKPLRSPRSMGTWWSPREARRLEGLLSRFEPDILHAHNVAFLSPSVLALARRMDIPVVMTLHDFRHELLQGVGEGPEPGLRGFLNRCKRRYVRKLVDRCCSALLCPSRALFERTEAWARRTRVHHLPYPVRLPGTVSPPSDGGPFLFLGRLIEDKGLQTLMEAWELSEKRPLIQVAGMGPMEATLRDHPGLRLLGQVERERIPGLLDSARALLVPSQWLENYPLSVLEAQAHARPVIATRVGGLPEMVEDGRSGLLVEPFDPRGFSEAMDRLASSLADCVEMGRRGRERVERENDPAEHDRRLLAIYRQRA